MIVTGKQVGHVLILIDEAESFFQNRFDSHTHPSDKKKTNFFLRWIDGDLEGSDNFTFVVTSNAWENVDPALKRSGRFAEIPYVPLTEEGVREALLVHIELAELKTGRQMFEREGLEDLELPAEITGADVKELVSEALLAKAAFFLDEMIEKGNEDLPDLENEESFVTVEELGAIIDKKASELKSANRTVGFGY